MNLTSKSIILFTLVALISSCNNQPEQNDIKDFYGAYLTDFISYPEDTIVLQKIELPDSTNMKKLLIEIKNDSLYLDEHNHDAWDARWFWGFTEARCSINKKK